MMNFNKPEGYDEVQAGGEFTPIELGGHKLVIKAIEEMQASNGKSYLKVSFDTAPDDKQPGYYAEAWKNDTRDQKKWSGVTTVFPTDKTGKASKTFKQFCTSIERSNNSQIQWGAGFEASIVGKRVGGVFGEEEYLNSNGDKKVAHKLFWWCSIENADGAKIPAKRELDDTSAGNAGFMDIPSGLTADDLPFK